MSEYTPAVHECYSVTVNCPVCGIGEVDVYMASYHPDDPVEPEEIMGGTCGCSTEGNRFINSDLYWEEVSDRARKQEVP